MLTAFTTTITGFLVTVPPLSLATTVLTTVCIVEYSDRFEGGQQGLAMGVWGSFDSVGGVIGPLLGGALFQYGGIWAVYMGATILSAWSYFISKEALSKDNLVTIGMD
jgi:MFS family permease